MISEVVLTREQILDQLVKTIEVHENISSFVGTRLCDHCESAEDEWAVKREKIAQQLQGLVKKYEFAKTLPRNELGIAVLAILGYIVKIQHTFASLIIMIDMIRGESFGDVYMDSMNSISTKTHDQLKALRELAEKQKNDTEGALECLETVLRLERQIDEDNIIICRQISVATEGEAGYVCYIMRKIVSELEHISDFIKEAAEIIVDI
ncbi:MAG: hypothetical protein ACW99V_03040 [Candidatus Thorarchaeota archaeon]|jgi:preprotein translocase subunit Sss1